MARGSDLCRRGGLTQENWASLGGREDRLDRVYPASMGIFRRKPVLTDDQRRELRLTATEWIAPGFRPRTGLAEELVDYHDDIEVPHDVLLSAASEVVEEVWCARLADEEDWPDTGDFGRLERAFWSLASQGVLARMDFSCCGTCGMAEIDDERTPLGGVVDGDYPYKEWAYTFFHQQDSERLVDSDAVLFLAYSAFRPAAGLDPELMARAKEGDEEARRQVSTITDTTVGELVRDALVAEGLAVTWNGSSAQRIAVNMPEWRKPLPRG